MRSFGVTAATYLDKDVATYPDFVSRTNAFRAQCNNTVKLESLTYQPLPTELVEDFLAYWAHRWAGIRQFYDVPSLCHAAVTDPFQYESDVLADILSALQLLLLRIGVHRLEDLFLLEKFDDVAKREAYRKRVVGTGFQGSVCSAGILSKPQADAAAPHVPRLFELWEECALEFDLSNAAISSYVPEPEPFPEPVSSTAPVRRPESASSTGAATSSANRPARAPAPPGPPSASAGPQSGLSSSTPPQKPSASAAASPLVCPLTPAPALPADESGIFGGAGRRWPALWDPRAAVRVDDVLAALAVHHAATVEQTGPPLERYLTRGPHVGWQSHLVAAMGVRVPGGADAVGQALERLCTRGTPFDVADTLAACELYGELGYPPDRVFLEERAAASLSRRGRLVSYLERPGGRKPPAPPALEHDGHCVVIFITEIQNQPANSKVRTVIRSERITVRSRGELQSAVKGELQSALLGHR